MNNNWQKNAKIIIALIIAFIVVACMSLIWGQFDIPLANALAIIFSEIGFKDLLQVPFTPEQKAVLWHIRLQLA